MAADTIYRVALKPVYYCSLSLSSTTNGQIQHFPLTLLSKEEKYKNIKEKIVSILIRTPLKAQCVILRGTYWEASALPTMTLFYNILLGLTWSHLVRA